MRYRPFGLSGIAMSAVSLALTDVRGWQPQDWTNLIYKALEEGVNTFEIVGTSPAILEGVGEALADIERRLVFVALRVGRNPTGVQDFSAPTLKGTIEAVIARTGLEYLDAVLLDDPSVTALSPEALDVLKALRLTGATRTIGVRGEDPAMDFYISMGAFDVLSLPYGLSAGWLDRRRMKAAIDKGMAVIGYGFVPADIVAQAHNAQPVKRGLFNRGARANPLEGAGTYAFLQNTPGWTLEELCLAYALTEPSLATVQVDTEQAARLTDLASVAERDLPTGLSSRIEMARFSVSGGDAKSQGRG